MGAAQSANPFWMSGPAPPMASASTDPAFAFITSVTYSRAMFHCGQKGHSVIKKGFPHPSVCRCFSERCNPSNSTIYDFGLWSRLSASVSALQLPSCVVSGSWHKHPDPVSSSPKCIQPASQGSWEQALDALITAWNYYALANSWSFLTTKMTSACGSP